MAGTRAIEIFSGRMAKCATTPVILVADEQIADLVKKTSLLHQSATTELYVAAQN